MSAEGYLELHERTVDPTAGTPLFGSKRYLPAGWFWFFEASDFQRKQTPDEGVFTLLARPLPEAIAVARRRQAALTQVVTKELRELLETLIVAVEKAGGEGDWLVLNSHQLESSKAELTGPTTWLTALEARPDARGVLELESIFDEDADDGLIIEGEEDGPPQVHFTGEVGVIGWPVDADDDEDDEGDEEE